MTDIVLVNSVANTLNDTIEKFYDSPAASSGGQGTRISAFTASNNATASASYKAYIYDASAAVKEAVVPLKIVVKDRFNLAPSIVGHVIPPGGSLRMESSTAGAITFRVTGSEL